MALRRPSRVGQAARGRHRHFAGRGLRRLPRGVAALAAPGGRQAEPCPQAGRRLIDVDPERAKRIERQVEALAELVAREGVTVHRPQRLEGEERTFLAPNGEGAQLFPATA